MKKQLTVALGLAVLATPAFATKARLEALGEDNFGSYYINDNRNMFLNPAYINNHKDLVTYEFGRTGAGASAAADSANSPKAEGGFTKGHGNFVYGLHFGNSTPSAGLVRGLVGNTNLQERNPWDFFIGGDAGMKWGANFTYEEFDGGNNGSGVASPNRVSSHALRTRIGVIAGDVDAFAQINIKGDAKDYTGAEVEGKGSYFVGASTLLSNYRLFADYKMIEADYTADGGDLDNWEFQEIRVGAGRVEKLNDRANMFAKISVERRTIEDEGAGTLGAAGELTRYILPLNVGLEYDATSWLQLRASVTQYVWSNQEVDPDAGSKTSNHLANTAVRAGASLKFGEFQVDGLVSTDGDGDVSGGAGDATTNGGNGALRTDALMTRVSMLYRF